MREREEDKDNSLGSERVPSRGECEREKRTKTTALVQKGSQVVGSERERRGQRQQPWFRKGPKSWGVREREKRTKTTALVQKGSQVVGSERERRGQRQQPWFRKGPKSWGVREREKRTKTTALVQKGSQVVGMREREEDKNNSLGSEWVPSRGE